MEMNWNQKIVACWGVSESCVEKETAKAMLINGIGWLPKSQCELGNKDRKPFIVMPLWLAQKNINNSYNLLISEREKDELLECINTIEPELDEEPYRPGAITNEWA
jgi:hypothetical protein